MSTTPDDLPGGRKAPSTFHPGGTSLVRYATLLVFAVKVVLTIAFLVSIPTLLGLLYSTLVVRIPNFGIYFRPFQNTFRTILLVLLVIAQPTWMILWRLPARFWEWLETAAEFTRRHLLSPALGGLILVWLAGWAPHFLTWPFWSDTDHFVVSAMSWDQGILPYRDLYDFNFPGPMYVAWILGKTLGWGRTVPYYACELALMLLLVGALLYWSRARFETIVAGLSAVAIFLSYYLMLNYSMVLQRDWQVTCFAVLGLLALEVFPGRPPLIFAGSMFALALSFRPHAVLFGPAFLVAILEQAHREHAQNLASPAKALRPDQRSDESATMTDSRTPFRFFLKKCVIWASTATVGIVILAAPVLIAGIGDDLVRNFQAAWYGGTSNQDAKESLLQRILTEFSDSHTEILLWILIGISIFAPRRLAGMAGTWAVALVCVLFYKPLSPVGHGYLSHPRVLIEAVGSGLVVGSLAATSRFRSTVVLIVVLGLLSEKIRLTTTSTMLDWSRSLDAIVALARGVPPTKAPIGSLPGLANLDATGGYFWEDYNATIEYLRTRTTPDTRVANFIHNYPFPSVNGPSGRLTSFPCAEGIQWLRWVNKDLEQEFADRLIQAKPAVVVWAPQVSTRRIEFQFPKLTLAIRQYYRHEATFGRFQIWRRQSGDTPIPLDSLNLAPYRDDGSPEPPPETEGE